MTNFRLPKENVKGIFPSHAVSRCLTLSAQTRIIQPDYRGGLFFFIFYPELAQPIFYPILPDCAFAVSRLPVGDIVYGFLVFELVFK